MPRGMGPPHFLDRVNVGSRWIARAKYAIFFQIPRIGCGAARKCSLLRLIGHSILFATANLSGCCLDFGA